MALGAFSGARGLRQLPNELILTQVRVLEVDRQSDDSGKVSILGKCVVQKKQSLPLPLAAKRRISGRGVSP